jgi:RNA polymerase sigma-70 factor
MRRNKGVTDNHFDLGNFIREHFASLCAIAFKLTGDSDVAQDIAQEVIIKYWENKKQHENLESIENYLFIMVRNESLNYLRGLSREKQRYENVEFINEQEDSLWDTIIEQEANLLLLEAINTLPPQCKRIVDLSLAGNSTKEIAAELGIAVNTVKVLKSRAIHKLREYFSENDVWIEF